jgi:hypothetical protein
MAKKDLNNSENIDHNNKAQEDWESHHTAGDRFPEEAKGIAETEVKNAHAAGDGAYGRTDKGLGVDDERDEKEKKEDPPY